MPSWEWRSPPWQPFPPPPQSPLATILVVEDNLVKGASGQAVQVMNLMFGLPEDMGLTHIPVLP